MPDARERLLAQWLAETRAFSEAPEQWSPNHGGRPPAPRSMMGR